MNHIITLLFFLAFLISCKKETEKPLLNIHGASDTLKLFSPDLISTSQNQRDLAISEDGSEIWYTLSTQDNSFRALIQVKLEGMNVIHREVASFSGSYSDIEPFYAPDGNRLYFSSDRPTAPGDSINDYNIWFVEQIDGQWGEPKNIGEPVNTSANEFFPSVASNGNLYFTATSADSKGKEDIYISEWKNGRYSQPVSLDSAINTPMYEFNAYVSPDEKLIVFTSYGRSDGIGGGDLYVSHKDDQGNWMPSKNLGAKINSEQLDYCPFIDYPRGVFYFTSNRKIELEKPVSLEDLMRQSNSSINGQGSIYHINLNQID